MCDILQKSMMNKLSNTSQNSTVKSDFAHYFSNLNSIGLSSILKDDHEYDVLSKQDWIALLIINLRTLSNKNLFFLQFI